MFITIFMKLTFKLKIIILLITLIGFVTLGGLSLLNAQDIVSDQLDDLTNTLVEGLSDNMSNTMTQYRRAASILSKSDVTITAYETRNYQQLLGEFENFNKEFPHIMNIYIGYESRDFPIYPSVELPEDYDPTARPWYAKAEEAGEAVWIHPYINVMDGSLIVPLAVPVYDSSSKFIGVLSMDINLSYLNDELNQMQLVGSGYPVLIDAFGNTMTHKIGDLIGMPIPVMEIVNAIANSDDGRVEYVFTGSKKSAYFSKVEETGWRVLVVLSDDEVAYNVKPILSKMVLVALATLILIFTVMTFSTTPSNEDDLDR